VVRHLVNVAVVGCSAPDCQVFHKDLVEVPSLLVCYRARVEGRGELELLQLSCNYRQLLIEVSAYDDLCILVLLHNKPQNPKTPHECVRGGNIVNKGVLNSN